MTQAVGMMLSKGEDDVIKVKVTKNVWPSRIIFWDNLGQKWEGNWHHERVKMRSSRSNSWKCRQAMEARLQTEMKGSNDIMKWIDVIKGLKWCHDFNIANRFNSAMVPAGRGPPHTLQTNCWCGCGNDSRIDWSVDVTLNGPHTNPTSTRPRFLSVGLSEGPCLWKPPLADRKPENRHHGKDQSYAKRGVRLRNWPFLVPHSGVPATMRWSFRTHFGKVIKKQMTWTAEPKLSGLFYYQLSLILMKNKANLSTVVERTSTFMGCIHFGSPFGDRS